MGSAGTAPRSNLLLGGNRTGGWKESSFTSASAPEIKFAVLSTADFRELSRLKKSNSHLALGVFYARVGLLNEAQREFEKLVELNPESELPRKLIQSVRTH